jgi:hypothetical protein
MCFAPVHDSAVLWVVLEYFCNRGLISTVISRLQQLAMTSLRPASNAGARQGLHPYRTPQLMLNKATAQRLAEPAPWAPEARSHSGRRAHRSHGSRSARGDTVVSSAEQPSEVVRELWRWSLWDDIKMHMSAPGKLQLVAGHWQSFADHDSMMRHTVFRTPPPQDPLPASAPLAPMLQCRLPSSKSLLVASSFPSPTSFAADPLLVVFGR